MLYQVNDRFILDDFSLAILPEACPFQADLEARQVNLPLKSKSDMEEP